MDKELFDVLKKNIDHLITEDFFIDKEILCFGYCEATEEMVFYLRERGITVKAILDNNQAKQGKTWRTIPIVNPLSVLEYNSEKTVVLIASRAYESMKKQLITIGFKGSIKKLVEYNSFAEYSLDTEVIEEKNKRVKRGKMLLDKIIKPETELYVVCPYCAFGDVYMAMKFLPEYLERYQISNYEVIVTGQGSAMVARMFTEVPIRILQQVEMDELVQAVLFYETENALIAHHDRPYLNDMTCFIDVANFSFEDLYRFGVFGLGKDSKGIAPKYGKQCSEKYILEKGNTVILSPYAKSVVKLDDSFWIDLVKQYKSYGRKIFTNIGGNEQPILGTLPLRLPLDEMIDAVEYAGYFVGIRSGLCDIIDSAKCEKTVVFPDAYYSVTKTKVSDFFALHGWNTIVLNDRV